MAREIPGFYYDEEKKKYFKIQANHLVGSTSSASQYSRENINKKRRLEEFGRANATQQRTSRSKMVERSRFLEGRVANGFIAASSLALHRSIGSSHPLIRSCRRSEDDLYPFFAKQHRLIWTRDREVNLFLRDPSSGKIYANHRNQPGVPICSYAPRDPESAVWEYNSDAYTQVGPSSRTGNTLQGLALMPQGIVIAAYHSLLSEASLLTLSPSRASLEDDVLLTHLPEINYVQMCSHHIPWCVAACPDSTVPRFAVASSNGLITGRINRDQSSNYWFHSKDAVQATCWLDSNVLAMGANDSTVSLFDTRGQAKTTSLKAPQGVTALRRVDDWRIVAAAKKSNLHLYDIRYPATDIQRTRHRAKARCSHTTRPYLSFDEFERDILPDKSMDVSPELGILAAVSEFNKIQLFSLATGKLLAPEEFRLRRSGQDRSRSSVTSFAADGSIECLRFDQPRSGDGQPSNAGNASLLVSHGQQIDEWRV